MDTKDDPTSSWARHLENLHRCRDKQQRDTYLEGVERTTSKSYRRDLQVAWFNEHNARADNIIAQYDATPKKRSI